MLHYIPIGPRHSVLARTADGKKKQLVLANGERAALQIPKWSNKEEIRTSSLPEDQPIALHCGLSGLIVLDFDNELFNTAIALNDDLKESLQCSKIYKSVGKDGGHFIYSYEPNLLTEFIASPNGKKQNQLDTLYGNTLVFASTAANSTKEVLVDSGPLIPMPLAMQQLAIARYATLAPNSATHQMAGSNAIQGTKLARLAEAALTGSITHLNNLLHIITPRRYKEIMALSRKPLPPYHPDRLAEDESAHMYLVALSGVAMLDCSIDPLLHKKLLHYINEMFSQPLDAQRVDSIVNHDVQQASYTYDPDWQQKSFVVTNYSGEPVEVFMHTTRGAINYLVFNHLTASLESYNSSSGVIDYLASEAKVKVQKDRLTKSCTHVGLIARPDEPFGYNHTARTFNTYIWNRQQEAFYKPEDYRASWSPEEQSQPYNAEHPRYPLTTLRALESSVGRQLPRFMSFMHRKFKTREHSPLFFVFFGVPHSFKSAIVNGVFTNLASGRHKTLGVEVISDKWNDWMVDTDLVLVDEVHQDTAFDRAKLIKHINEISGNKTIAGVRRMHQSVDAKVYPQEITFILTTNAAVQLTTEARDRRMVVFKSLTRVADALNLSNHEIERRVIAESTDFSYYLATEVQPLLGDEYISNAGWKGEDYTSFQEHGQDVESRLIKAIDSNDLVSFLDITQESGLLLEDMAKCIYKPRRGPHYCIRLLNSQATLATVPAILQHTVLDLSKIRRHMQTISHLKYNVTDYKGTERTGNKKVEWNALTLPHGLAELVHNICGEDLIDYEELLQ